MSNRIDDIYNGFQLDSELTYEEILYIFNSDMFDYDVWSKIDYIESNQTEYNHNDLIDIYDSL